MTGKIDSQMLKGVLTGSILVLLSKEELYGYGLSERLAQFGFNEISNGTIYPLLLALEKKKLIEGKMRASESGPPRKYYYITAAGLAEKALFLEQWKKLQENMARIVEGVEEDEER